MSGDKSWLWLYGPCGVGKTAVGYELFSQLAGAGYRMGFIEVDQLGMCRPAADVEVENIKVANLLAALGTFARAGVDGVIVSGDIAGPPMDKVLAQAPSPGPLLCRLRAEPATFEARLRSRGAPPEYADAARHYDDQFNSRADFSVATDGLAVAEVTSEVLRHTGGWPHRREPVTDDATSVEALVESPKEVVLVCGPTAVGKSSVAWQVFMSSVLAGVKTAYLDLGQLGFLEPPSKGDPHNVSMKAGHVGLLWQNFARSGARRLILSGDVDGEEAVAAYRRALAVPRIHVYSLAAGVDELRKRALARAEGRGIELPGDQLRGRPADEIEMVVRAAAERARTTRRWTFPDLHLETDGCSAARVAHRIVAHAFDAKTDASDS